MLRRLQEHPGLCIDGHAHRQESRVAYCWCDDHRGYLTTKLMREHKCLDKQCGSFQKLPGPYWAQVDRQKRISRQKRKQKQLSQLRDERFLAYARDFLQDKTNVYITTAGLVRPGLIKITFIGKSSPGLYGLADYMKAKTRCSVWLRYTHTERDILQALIKNKNCGEGV
jgi:hypothetical protein